MKASQGLSEKQIENSILSWLMWKGIFVWKTKTVGTFDVRKKRFLKTSRFYMTGVADIIGILPPDGRLLAIEVKTAKGRLQENQKLFLSEVKARGGLAFVARSVEDVENTLKMEQVC